MNSPQLDHSVLRSSIDVSITGMKQAIHALENGNKEVSILVIIIRSSFTAYEYPVMNYKRVLHCISRFRSGITFSMNVTSSMNAKFVSICLGVWPTL